MIIDFFKQGTGGSDGPIDYFLGKDRDREYAKLLSGDLEEVAELIDSSPYIKKYTSGCLSFYEDNLSDAKKKNLMAAFEKTLFPGLDLDQYRIVWIEHRDKENVETGEKRLELNFLIPNVEITTGKRLQPFFAKADLNRVDDFKNIVNYKYQLFDPDDPINRRSVKIAKNLPQDKKDFISAMNAEVALAITEGQISDRESLKSWMTEIGLEITRITKNHISVKNPNNPEGKPIPLKGEFYEQNFRHSEQSAELKREASERYRREADSRYTNCIERYKKLCESKSEYHLERYATRDTTDSAEFREQPERQEDEHTSQYKWDGAGLEQRYAGDAKKLTDSNTELEKGLTDVKRIEPNHSRASEAEESPFFIEYSFGFDSTYFSYFEHLSKLRKQEQIQRYKRDAEQSGVSEIRRREHEYQQVQQPIMHSNRHEQTELYEWIPNSERGQLNDVRSTIIEDYRRSTIAIKETTASTRRSFTAYTSTVIDHQRIEEIHTDFRRKTQGSSEDRAEISANSARAFRANYLSKFFRKCTRELENTVTDTFKRFSEELADREPGPKLNQARNTEFGASRDRATIDTIVSTNEKEVRLNEQLSRKISRLSTDPIFKALDQLDRRKELRQQKEQVMKNDRDSPSPF